MAIKIEFDQNHNAKEPTLVLGNRSGRLFGKIPAIDTTVKVSLNSYSEIKTDVYKKNCDGLIWDNIKDFKLLWAKEWNSWYEINVDVGESQNIKKTITATSLGEAELSQVNTEDIEINSELDLEVHDYKPTILFDPDHEETSLLHRLLKKTPHYRIGYVSDSIKNIQRNYEFNGSIYDAFMDIKEKINCLFIFDCRTDFETGKIIREVNVYDTMHFCASCGNRGYFDNKCDKCGSTNIVKGYGEDTTVFISTDNLADNINYTTKTDALKNCFKLSAGDDLMTSVIKQCNIDGSLYLWYFSDYLLEDVSDELRNKLREYKMDCEKYEDDYYLPDISVTTKSFVTGKIDGFETEEIDGNIFIKNITINIETQSGTVKRIYGANNIQFQDTIKFDNFIFAGIINGEIRSFVASNNELVINTQKSAVISMTQTIWALDATFNNGVIQRCFYNYLIEGNEKKNETDETVKGYAKGYLEGIGYVQGENDSLYSSDKMTKFARDILKGSYDSFYGYGAFAEETEHETIDVIPHLIKGNNGLVSVYYNIIDFRLFLEHEMMPIYDSTSTAQQCCNKINNELNNKSIAVSNIETCSDETVTNSVVSMAKAIINSSKYRITIPSHSFDHDEFVWEGTIYVEEYEGDDFAQTDLLTISVNDNYKDFIKQKLEKIIGDSRNKEVDIVTLFGLPTQAQNNNETFSAALKEYCLSKLRLFYDVCQSCVDLLIKQGFGRSWGDLDEDGVFRLKLYDEYNTKLSQINYEIERRENELFIIDAALDFIQLKMNQIHKKLDLKNYLSYKKNHIGENDYYIGDDLWNELSAYRRENEFRKEEYISDGLDNKKLVASAIDFIDSAKTEIKKSAIPQHEITADLSNLLVRKEFEPIFCHFEIGNWLRIRVDESIFILRLVDYEIKYGELNNIYVTFSDAKKNNTINDFKSVISDSKKIASTYNRFTNMARKGDASNKTISNWKKNGISLNDINIGDHSSSNTGIGKSGVISREYDGGEDDYLSDQVKLVNGGLYYTNNKWETSSPVIGKVYYKEDGSEKSDIGVIANYLDSPKIITNNGLKSLESYIHEIIEGSQNE